MSNQTPKSVNIITHHRCILAKKFIMEARSKLADSCCSCVDRNVPKTKQEIESAIASLEAALREFDSLNPTPRVSQAKDPMLVDHALLVFQNGKWDTLAFGTEQDMLNKMSSLPIGKYMGSKVVHGDHLKTHMS